MNGTMPTITERFETIGSVIKPAKTWEKLDYRSMFALTSELYSGGQISTSIIDEIENMLPGNSPFFILRGDEYLHPAGLELIPVETVRETIKNDTACIFRRQLYVNRRINELGYILLCTSLGKNADGDDIAVGLIYSNSRSRFEINEDHLFSLLGEIRRHYDSFCQSKTAVSFAQNKTAFRYVIDPAHGDIIILQRPNSLENSQAADALNRQVIDHLIPGVVTDGERAKEDHLIRRRFKNLKISRIKLLGHEYMLLSFKPADDILSPGENYEELIRSFSHKLKGKLSAIHTASSQLSTQEGSVIDKDDAALLTIIESAIEGADNLVTRLDKYINSNSRSEEQVDLHRLIQDTVTEKLSGLKSRPCPSLALKAVKPCVRGDSSQLKKAIDEILTNAIEACPPSGEIFIGTSQDEENISVTARNDLSPSIRYDSPATVADLHRPFISGKPRHAGMGLSIVRRIIEDHGGEVAIDKYREETFKVTLSLPVDDEFGEES